MSVIFYNIFLAIFKAGIFITSLFDDKAKKWLRGRKNILEKLESIIPADEKIVWMHCASLGEFEQGRPLLEEMKSQFPNSKFLLTFFSPSGYEVQKTYKGADWVFYLPVDGPGNAKRFLEIVNPVLVVFVKYEFWYYYLKKIKYRKIPLLLVSALFRKDMSFFKWYGGLQRKMLSRFDHLFVQNEDSKRLLDQIGLAGNCTVSGDTRFDRVIGIAEKFEPIPPIEKFIGQSRAIIAGSTWKEDEEILQNVFMSLKDHDLRLIIAPHEINENHLAELKKLFPESLLFSQLPRPTGSSPSVPAGAGGRPPASRVLIIDNIGLLSRLYKYSYISFVGGAFKKGGVHNVLEAAVYGRPVLFGPEYKKYSEAIDLVETEGAVSVMSEEDCLKSIRSLLENKEEYKLRSERSMEFVWKNKGATAKILQFIQENRLLTR